MKKNLFYLMLIAMTAFVVAACTPAGQPEKTPAAPTEAAKTASPSAPSTSQTTPTAATAGTLPMATDGHIFYMGPVNNALQVWVMNADGSGRRPITKEPGENAFASVSSDGQMIAFTSSRDKNLELYVSKADGTEAKRLTNDPAQDNLAIWSPDGTQLAFSSNRDGDNPDVYVTSRSGEKVTRLTKDAASDLAGSWSPDGKRIAFVSDRDGDQEIYTLSPGNADNAPTKLTDNKASDGSPTWSPDGKHLAFHSDRDGNPDIYVMDADGSNVQRLTNDPEDDLFPIWSPDGKKIAYTAQKGNALEIHILDVATQSTAVIPDVVGLATGWVASNNVLADVPLPTPRPVPPTPTSPPVEGNEISPDILKQAPFEGDPKAPVLIVEFSDYQCPYCKRFVDETLTQLRSTYIETGKARLVFVDYPLPIHPQAPTAALAAWCAGDQDAYWKMHNTLFDQADRWVGSQDVKAVLTNLAGEIGLDTSKFKDCLDQELHTSKVKSGIVEGERLAVSGTPTFFVNGRRLVGAQPFSAFRDLIEQELSKK